MSDPARPFDDDAEETEALSSAVSEARADRRGVPHEEMKAWLRRIADGEFDAAPLEPRNLG